MCSYVAPDNGICSETPAYLLYVCHSAVAGVGKYRLKIYRFVFQGLVYFAFVLFSRTFWVMGSPLSTLFSGALS